VLQVYLLSSLINLGETRDLASLLTHYVRDSMERGDYYAAAALKTWRSNVAWLVIDRPDEARRMALESPVQAIGDGFHLHHHHELLTHGHIDLYEGDHARVWRRLEDAWPKLERSHLFRIQSVLIEALLLRAQAALARAAGEPRARAQALVVAERSLRRVERERSPWGDAVSPLLHAGIAVVRGQRDVALAHLDVAAERLEQFDMKLLAAVARRRLGELLGGDEGAATVAAADAWMKEQGVVSPARVARMYAPGFALGSIG
jgi:eukaryotic-like serine/threonine-protein kinase